jgi:hypothetical protein
MLSTSMINMKQPKFAAEEQDQSFSRLIGRFTITISYSHRNKCGFH